MVLKISCTSLNFQHPASVGLSVRLTVRCVPCSWGCILKDDRHEGLPDGALPGLGHLTADAAVRNYLARGGRGWGESLRVARGQRGESIGVLPNEVAHSASNELKAVRICAWGDEREVSSRTHLQDLRQRDLLQDDASVM